MSTCTLGPQLSFPCSDGHWREMFGMILEEIGLTQAFVRRLVDEIAVDTSANQRGRSWIPHALLWLRPLPSVLGNAEAGVEHEQG